MPNLAPALLPADAGLIHRVADGGQTLTGLAPQHFCLGGRFGRNRGLVPALSDEWGISDPVLTRQEQAMEWTTIEKKWNDMAQRLQIATTARLPSSESPRDNEIVAEQGDQVVAEQPESLTKTRATLATETRSTALRAMA